MFSLPSGDTRNGLGIRGRCSGAPVSVGSLFSQPSRINGGGRVTHAKGDIAVSSQISVPGPAVRLDVLIDRRPVGRFHFLVLALTGSVMFLDGLDTQMISFIAPAVANEWSLPVAALGPIFSASIVGLMVGYLLLSPLANRIGHRKLVIVATALFGVLTLLCALAGDQTQLLVLRLLTGVGLGATIPSAVALASEFAPTRRRSTFVMFIYCWLALGFVAASLISGAVIPAWGWRPMFVLGGILPLLLVLVLLRFLPDSPSYLLVRDEARAHATLRRLDPDLGPATRVLPAERSSGVTGAPGKTHSPLFELFQRHWLVSTALLWIAFMLNLGVFYAVQSWLPTILGRLGHAPSTAVAATALTTVGGIAAAIVIGPSMDRRGPYGTLSAVYLLGAVFVSVLAFAVTGSSWMLLVAAFLAGTCITGGQMSVIALATMLYPPRIRPTGVGWALGIGRIGGILGPLLVGFVLGSGATPRTVFLAMGVVLVVASAAVFALAKASRSTRAASQEHPSEPPTSGAGADIMSTEDASSRQPRQVTVAED
ncbi:MFS transporter [Pseudonocardia sp. GCM10023141]|uniref:MFS transporter n=1 Tax=Pseudonocardia sp. GCM10023141 TaxID=3252653 RepID=UPI00361918C9